VVNRQDELRSKLRKKGRVYEQDGDAGQEGCTHDVLRSVPRVPKNEWGCVEGRAREVSRSCFSTGTLGEARTASTGPRVRHANPR
jgi:hypothetical protein